MRLAHVIPSYPQLGGVGTVIANLVAVSHSDGDPTGDQVLTYFGDVYRGLPALQRHWYQALGHLPWAVPLPADPVLSAVKSLPSGSAVITHGVFTRCCSRVTALTRRYRPDLIRIAFPHDPYDAGLFGSHSARKKAYWRLVERPYLRRADLVVCLAESHVDRLRERGVTTPVLVTKLGLAEQDVNSARAVAGHPRRGPSDPPRLLVLGRWDVYEKGLDLLCGALGRIAPNAQIRFVGPPMGGTDQLMKLISGHRLSAAEPLGFVDDVWEHIGWADALCMPSRKEGFGLSALQALAAARPVLLSRAAGLAEHLGSCRSVVLVDPCEESVVAGLKTLLESAGPGGTLDTAAREDQERILRFAWSETRRSIIDAARTARV